MKKRKTTKADLTAYFSTVLGISQTEAEHVITSLAHFAYQNLLRGRDVTLPGIGILCPTKTRGGIKRNPRTGQPLNVGRRPTVKIRPAKALIDLLCQSQSPEQNPSSPQEDPEL